MELRRINLGWEVAAPAKVNLSLRLLGKRADGYHDLETLLVPLDWADELRLEPRPASNTSLVADVELAMTNANGHAIDGDIPRDGRNLVVRAIESLAWHSGRSLSARVRLTKRIPSQAGLGGGSSDAAATLIAGNAAWNLGLSACELSTIAAGIGSDVPGLVAGSAAICTGRGEVVTPVSLPSRLPMVIVKPSVGLSTAAVFSNVQPCDGAAAADPISIVHALRAGDLTAAAAAMGNQLQQAAERLAPGIARCREWFQSIGAPLHQMTGSGSAYFAMARNWFEARRWAALTRATGLGAVFLAGTR